MFFDFLVNTDMSVAAVEGRSTDWRFVLSVLSWSLKMFTFNQISERVDLWPLTSELTVEFSHRSCWRCVHWCSVNVMFVWRSAETWADVSMQVCKVNSVMWPRQTSVWLEWKSFIIKINFDMTEVNTFDGFQYVRFCIINFVISYWFDYILFFLCDFSFNLNVFF